MGSEERRRNASVSQASEKSCKTCKKPITNKSQIFNCIACGDVMHMTKTCTGISETAILGISEISQNVLLLCNCCVGNNRKESMINDLMQTRPSIAETKLNEIAEQFSTFKQEIDSHYEEIDAQIENEECIVAKLTGETGHHQILCCVYNPPKNSKYQWKQQNFISLFENLTKLQIQHNCNAVSITGDINFEYTHWKMMHSKDKYENAVLKKLIELDYEQLFDSKKKQLDVLLTNNPGVILNWHTDHSATNAYSIDKVSCSDHYAYSATINMEASIKEINKDESLAFNRADWKIINQEIKDKPFIPYCYSNVNELLRQWYAWLWDKIKNNVPKVTSHINSPPMGEAKYVSHAKKSTNLKTAYRSAKQT